jgi:hypothetical protein
MRIDRVQAKSHCCGGFIVPAVPARRHRSRFCLGAPTLRPNCMPAAFRIRQLLLNLNEQRPPQLREQMRSLNYVLD